MDTKLELKTRIEQIIIEQLGVDLSKIAPEARFIEDLGGDSLDIVELIVAVESEFGLEIPNEDADKLTTVQSLIDYVDRKLGQEGPQQ